MLSEEELIVDSRVILKGQVMATESRWDESEDAIWTYVMIAVQRVYKGNIASPIIVLKQMGGAVGLVGMEVFGQPQFERGREVLLYLNTSSDGTLHTAHCFMGMFSISEDAQGRKIVSRVIDDGVNLLSRRDNRTVTDLELYQDHIERIETTLEKQSLRIAQREAERSHQPIVLFPPELDNRRSGGYTPAFALLSGGVRWFQPDSNQPVYFNYNPENSPVSGGGREELTRALSAWARQSGARIDLRLGGQTSKCGLATDNENVISFGDCQGQLDPPSGCSGVVALTRVLFYASETKVINGVTFKRLGEADVVFNREMDCFLGASANLAEVACHEIGHGIGLSHSPDAGALMYSAARGRGRDATLGTDDKEGVLSIYPSSQDGTPTGPPRVSRVKVKTETKLQVYGENFSYSSLALLNGAVISPRSFTSGKLTLKGSFNLRPEGTNVLQVINGTQRSPLFNF
jgi:hypothetical protein